MLLDGKPNLSNDEAASIVRSFYDLEAVPVLFPSYQDQNFLLETDQGTKYVLKIANTGESRELLEAQCLVMQHLYNHDLPVPQVMPSTSGETIVKYQSQQGDMHLVRLVSYLPGKPFAEQHRRSTGLLNELGELAGEVSVAFADFDHPALHRYSQWDLRNTTEVIDDYLPYVNDPEIHAVIRKFQTGFIVGSSDQLTSLRHCVVHNDLNDYNVLVGGGDSLYSRNQNVVGVLDFGDMLYSLMVAELAITIAYGILDKSDPLAVAMEIVRGFHEVYPLREDEIAILFDLVCMRLCTSICLAAYKANQHPGDEYINISQEPIQRILPRLAEIPKRFAEAAFRAACDMEPVKDTSSIEEWMSFQDSFVSVFGVELDEGNCRLVDLSISSPLIEGQPYLSPPEYADIIIKSLSCSSEQFAIGRYGETRGMNASSAPRMGESGGYVNLGMEIFTRPGTPVYAPLDGVIVAKSDYSEHDGQILIVKHQTENEIEFYTLYRNIKLIPDLHLSIGGKIIKGEKFASLAPYKDSQLTHCQIQVITDILGVGEDFPAFCRFEEQEVWRQFTLNPNLLLRVHQGCFPQEDLDKAGTLALRRELVGSSLSLGYREPLKIVRGWMQYLYDDSGRKFLDAYNNVPHAGHCHPAVVRAAKDQLGVLNTNTRYLHDNLVRYAKRLTDMLPEPLRVCFFVNSGSEANELALRMARTHTGGSEMIVLEAAYHGHTTSMVDLSPYKHDGPGGSGAQPWVHTAPIPDDYRGMYKRSDPQAGLRYAAHVEDIIRQLELRQSSLAGFIAETYPSVGGQIITPVGYLAAVYDHVRKAGGVCIADEVQTGYGRTGRNFYAFQGQQVIPDILVLGKPIGNGHPIGVVITTPEIAASFDNGMEFFSTFGGNTVSCAVGLAVLNIVLSENLQEHALQVGEYLLGGLRLLMEKYAIIGDVRGEGLFLGMELVRNRQTLEPAAEEAAYICDRMRERGILFGTDGPYHNVLKIRPPMPFNVQDADNLLSVLGDILEEDFS